jgi:hypothetical protein
MRTNNLFGQTRDEVFELVIVALAIVAFDGFIWMVWGVSLWPK